jgi:hypothetical protein
MAAVGRVGAGSVYDIGSAPNSRGRMFDLSSPAGWTMVWYGLSIAIILLIFFTL